MSIVSFYLGYESCTKRGEFKIKVKIKSNKITIFQSIQNVLNIHFKVLSFKEVWDEGAAFQVIYRLIQIWSKGIFLSCGLKKHEIVFFRMMY